MTHEERDYLDFLVKSVELDNRTRDYSMLLEYLHKKRFYPEFAFKLDIDREKSGVEMREEYAFKHIVGPSRTRFLSGLKWDLEDGISTMEFMVALSKSMSETLYFEPQYGKFFWSMIDNLGLNCMDDGEFDEAIVDDILAKLWGHKYCRDGSGGGLFYVPNSKFDMRKIDFMLQANLWISYNFVRS